MSSGNFFSSVQIQQRLKGGSERDSWFSPVIIGKYVISKAWKIAIRAGYFQDKTGIIIPTITPNAFKSTRLSLNFDYAPIKNIICRREARWLSSRGKIFKTTGMLTNNNFILATSITFRFQRLFKGKYNSIKERKEEILYITLNKIEKSRLTDPKQ